MPRLVLCLVVLALLVIETPSSAGAARQADDGWRVVLYAPAPHQLITIDDALNVTTTPLPDDAPRFAAHSAASRDGAHAAFTDPSANRVALIDLTSQTILDIVRTEPPLTPTRLLFSPDGAQLAVAYETSTRASGSLHVYNIDGALAASLYADEPLDLRAWTDAGLYYYALCAACTAPDEPDDAPLLRWQPGASDMGERVDLTTTAAGDILFATGETVTAVHVGLFPTIINPRFAQPWHAYRNAVVLTGSRAADGRAVVYFDAANTALASVRWVADGRALLVKPSEIGGFSALVIPNSEAPDAPALVRPVVVANEQFLAATPDGWLMQDEGGVQHLAVGMDGAITQTTVDAALVAPTFSLQVAAAPTLPVSDAPVLPFPPVAAPVGFACPNVLPALLTVGGGGFVTPGAANNVRSAPTTSAPVVGQIAGGAAFDVLAGPVCANGFVWWQVAHAGVVTGWTVEADAQTYYTLARLAQ